MSLRTPRTVLLGLVAVSLCGVVAPQQAGAVPAAPGTTSYGDWSWSVDGAEADPWVLAQMQGTPLHYEGSGYSGITARIRGNESEAPDNYSRLQRDLSWVDDGYVTIATVDADEGWERDDKRYKMTCGQYIRYRMTNSSGESLYAAKIYARRGDQGQQCN